MAVPVYALDLYPRDDPRDGSLIRTLTPQKAGWRDEANSTGSGFAEVRSTSDDGQAFNPLGLDYVRVRDIANADRIVGGFFNDKARIKLLSKTSSKLLRVEGAGTLSYLARAAMAPHTYLDIAIGQDPIGGTWHLSQQGPAVGGNLLGSILWRVVYEAQHYRVALTQHRHADGVIYTDSHTDDRASTDVGIPDLVLGFDQFEDSDGNPWTLPSGEFKAQVGESLLAVVKRLMEAGLYVEMDPDTFELRAWEGTDHRRDLTGSAWASDVVRLQAPTDGTIATGNILSDADREVAAHVKRRTLYVGQAGTYVKVTGSTDIPWEGGVTVDVEDADALEQVGETQLQARSDAGDTLKVRLKPGDDPTQGTYRAWEHVRPDDLITVHSGDDQWEYDEQNFPVAAISINLREGGDWDTWLELGSSFASADRRFSLAPVASHNHPPNPQLCLPTIAAEPTPVSGGGYYSNGVSQVTVPSGMTNGLMRITGRFLSDPGPPDPSAATVSFAGGTAVFVDEVINGVWGIGAWYVLNPTPGFQSLSFSPDGYRSVDFWENVDPADPIGSILKATGSGTAPALGNLADGDQWLNAMHAYGGAGEADPSADSPGVESWPPESAGFYNAMYGDGYGDQSPAWTLPFSATWMILGFGINGSGVGTGDSGPMPVGANDEADHGTSNRATRCDHVHPHSDLSDHADETHHHASSVEVTPFDTIAATNVQDALEELLAESGGVTLSDDTPLVESGSGDPGTSDEVSRSDHVHPEDGGGGGGASRWTQVINESGASFANFTAASGTWASDGTIIRQTDGSANQRRVRHNTKIPHAVGLIYEAEIRIPSAGQTAGGDRRAALLLDYNGANGARGMFVALRDDSDTIYIEDDAQAAVRSISSVTLVQDTWYKLRVIIHGPWAAIYLDGTFMGNANAGNAYRADGDYIGFYTYNVKVDYRNIKAWIANGDLPA